MDFKFSLAQLTVLNTSPLEITKMAYECGYDYVSLRQIYMNLKEEVRYELLNDNKMLKELEKFLSSSSIKILDVELARIYEGVDVREYERVFELSQRLKVRHILSSIWCDDEIFYTEKFDEMCEIAKKYDLTIDLEYVPIAGVKNLSQAINVLEKVHSTNAGIMIDTHHFQRAKDSVQELRKIDKKYFHFAHICDATFQIPNDEEELKRIMRSERLYLGQGGIDIKSILSAMPAIPYSIELPNKKIVDQYGYKIHAQNCIDTAREYCNNYVTPRDN